MSNPYRRLRDWVAQTPNGRVALNMMLVGAGLIVVAIVLAVVAL